MELADHGNIDWLFYRQKKLQGLPEHKGGILMESRVQNSFVLLVLAPSRVSPRLAPCWSTFLRLLISVLTFMLAGSAFAHAGHFTLWASFATNPETKRYEGTFNFELLPKGATSVVIQSVSLSC